MLNIFSLHVVVSVIITIGIDDHVRSGTKYKLLVYANNNQKQK